METARTLCGVVQNWLDLLQRSHLVQVRKIIKRNLYNFAAHFNNSVQFGVFLLFFFFLFVLAWKTTQTTKLKQR